MSSEQTERILHMVLLAAGVTAAVLWLLPRIVLPLLPLFAAWLFAALLQKPMALAARVHLPCGVAAALLVALVGCLAGAVGWLAVEWCVTELSALCSWVLAESDTLADLLTRLLAPLQTEEAPLLSDALQTAAAGALSNLAALLPRALGTVTQTLPRVLLVSVTLFGGTWYFTLRFKTVQDWLCTHLPHSVSRALPVISRSIRGYVCTHALLALFCAALLAPGFVLLGVQNAVKRAFLVAAVDLLPVLGAGAVLLPWAAGAALFGRRGLACGLFCLWVLQLCLRQIWEAKLLGQVTKLPGALSFFACVVGVSLFGAAGGCLAPLAAGVWFEMRQAKPE